MIVLDGTTEKIQLVLAAAIATNAIEWTANYSDYVAGTPSFTPINSDGTSNNTTDVDVVDSPAASTQRMIKMLAVFNKDTASATVTIKKDTAGSERILVKFTLSPGDTLQYEDGRGFECLDANGAVKTFIATTGTFLRTTVITTTGASTFTSQPSARTAFIRGIAGGGGGGGVNGNAAGNGTVAGGGSAGGYFEKTVGMTGNTGYSVVVGVGGSAGASGGGTGGTGGVTTIVVGGVTYQANGGLGGTFLATAVAAGFALGGASPAISTNGDVNSGGAPGNYGSLAAAGAAGCSGGGGSSQLGAGGNGNNATGQGTAALGYGAGGAGSLSLASGAAQAGLVGMQGVMIIDEYA